jgi:5-deoxy-glucuronate isomerase
MTELVVHPLAVPDADGAIIRVTPESAGWRYVGFEVLALGNGDVAARETSDREVCVVVVAGIVHISSEHGDWRGVGGRVDPWSGRPDAAYLPPGSALTIEGAAGGAEVALCWAPAPRGGGDARVLPRDELEVETRGHGAHERFVHPILMADREADSLLVCEVLTPAGHWSSYPPHKHDRDDPPDETLLEETYYHRVSPTRGFGLQRVYTDDRALDQTLAFGDRDCVLVPRGYHTVSAPPGYDVYYLNVMAGPTRLWAVANDPAHEWILAPEATSGIYDQEHL